MFFRFFARIAALGTACFASFVFCSCSEDAESAQEPLANVDVAVLAVAWVKDIDVVYTCEDGVWLDE